MSVVHALKPSELTVSDQPTETSAVDTLADDRGELRDCLNGQQATCARIDALLRGVAHAEEAASAADAEVEKCEAAVAEAKEHDSIAAANASIKGRKPKQSTTRQARNDLLEAQDAAEIAHAAVLKLREQLPALDEERKWCQVRILTARNKLLAPLIEQLSARVAEHQRNLARDTLTLSVLCEADEVPELEHGRFRAEKEIVAPIAEVSAEAKETLAGKWWAVSDYETRKQTAEQIRGTLDAMLESADAPLPEI